MKQGIHLIIKAIKKINREIPIKLDLYTQNWEGKYCLRIDKSINKDQNFKVFLNHNREDIFNKLDQYDL